jgi:superfamily I DNA/RNA helicase
MPRNEFEIAIAIKTKEDGDRYARPVLETGYMSVQKALDQANAVIDRKFGTGETLELHRPRRRRQRD